jgi:hypothetical protein
MANATFGVKLRAYSGAVLSLLDGFSDAYMIRAFLINGQTLYAMLGIGSLCLNLLIQLLLVFLQTRNLKENRTKTAFFQATLVLTFMKPGWDAHQVATNAEQPPGAPLDALSLLTFTRGAELFSESIIALLTQSVALVTSNNPTKSTAAIASLMISACTTAFISTTMTYDKDNAPSWRRHSPDFYGAVPKTGRGLAFVVMVALSLIHVISKTLATALLLVTNSTWLLCYMSGDIAFYLLQKVLRRDFIYWISGSPRLASI